MGKTTTFVLILAALASTSPAQTLFAPAGDRVTDPARPWVVRERAVRARLARIPGATARDAARGVLPPGGHRLVLNLFDDVVVRARMTTLGAAGQGVRLGGEDRGPAARRRGAHGLRRRADRQRHRAGGRVPDHGRGRGERGARARSTRGSPRTAASRRFPPARSTRRQNRFPRATTARSSTCWSSTRPPPARRPASTSAMLSLINTAVAETNTGYANSDVDPAPAPGGRGGGQLHRDGHQHRPRSRDGDDRRLHGQRPRPPRHLQGGRGRPHRRGLRDGPAAPAEWPG